jgi:hypothetical protein
MSGAEIQPSLNPLRLFFSTRDDVNRIKDAKQRWGKAPEDYEDRLSRCDAQEERAENMWEEYDCDNEDTEYGGACNLISRGQHKTKAARKQLDEVEDPKSKKERWNNSGSRQNRRIDKDIDDGIKYLDEAFSNAQSASRLETPLTYQVRTLAPKPT